MSHPVFEGILIELREKVPFFLPESANHYLTFPKKNNHLTPGPKCPEGFKETPKKWFFGRSVAHRGPIQIC